MNHKQKLKKFAPAAPHHLSFTSLSHNIALRRSCLFNCTESAESSRTLVMFVLVAIMLLGCLILDACSNYRSLDMRGEIDGVEVEMMQRNDQTLAPRTASPGVEAEEDFSCDRSHYRTDVCELKGDVRIDGKSGAVVLYSPERQGGLLREEKIRPYTRKWEKSVMDTIDEVSLRRVGNYNSTATESSWLPECEVRHEVPAVVFSTGGYTGNVYHEFNDGLIPLFISSQHLRGEVVLVILEYHKWWVTKYEPVVQQLTRHQILDFARDKSVHCFPEAMVGLRIHDELAIDPTLMKPPAAASITDFQQLLHQAYITPFLNQTLTINPIKSTKNVGIKAVTTMVSKPKLVIISRKSPRALLNQRDVKSLAQRIGFEVEILSPGPSMEMSHVFRILSTCDVMLGVHGAAMTHLLFMRPGATFIQVVPLGTDWAAHTYYGEPAMKLGLDYVPYKVAPQESSLWEKYGPHDPVLRDPDSVNRKGWWETKKIYLNGQDVRLSLQRFRPLLRSAYTRAVTQFQKSHER